MTTGCFNSTFAILLPPYRFWSRNEEKPRLREDGEKIHNRRIHKTCHPCAHPHPRQAETLYALRHLLSSAWLITFDTVSFNSLFVKHKLCFSLSKYQPAGIGVPAAVFPAFPGTFALHPQVPGSLFREETVLIDRDAGRHTPHLIQHALFLRAIQRADTAVLLHGNELELFNRSVAAVESDPENAGISCAGTEEVVAEAVEYGYTVYILNILQNVRVGSDDQVCACIDKRLCLFDLPGFRSRHEFRSPVNKDDAEIRFFFGFPDSARSPSR